MKIIYKRGAKKMRRLIFKCKRCGCKFITRLYPNCTFEYSEYLESAHDGAQPVFVKGFVNIRTTCPDCGKVLEYGKKIDLYRNDQKVK